MNHNSPQSGFTLIELIIVIAIGVTLSTVGFLTFSSYKNKKDVEFSLNEVFSVIKEVRSRSVTQEDGKAWGVRLNSSSTSTDSYEIFSGSTYSTSSVEASWGFRRPVEFSEPSGGRTVDLTFEAITGKIDNRKIISIVHKKGLNRVGDIIINTLGKATARLEDDIVGYWHFDEGTGTSTLDASGNDNDGELINGPNWAAVSDCKAGQCLGFDGTDDYVAVLNFPSLQITTPFTVMAWTKTNTLVGTHSIVEQYNWATGKGTFVLRQIGSDIKFSLVDGTSSDGLLASNAAKTEWQHVVGVVDGVDINLYVNGELVDSILQTKTIRASDKPVAIGTRGDTRDIYWYDGLIDDVRIYNRALSSSTIKAHYDDLK